MNTFDREAFGRRSFSEKRKASNGKNKEVVAKVKALREEMKLDVVNSQSNPAAMAGELVCQMVTIGRWDTNSLQAPLLDHL